MLAALSIPVNMTGFAGALCVPVAVLWCSNAASLFFVAALDADDRRWLPLRHERMLLGALQVQTRTVPWPESLGQRLQAVLLGQCPPEIINLGIFFRNLIQASELELQCK
jgi:hypothetical protein